MFLQSSSFEWNLKNKFFTSYTTKMKTKQKKYLLITVKLICRFRVGELRKSTRHLNMPSSDIWISSISNCAGCDCVRKNARAPNASGDDQSFACVNCLPRTSKLYNGSPLDPLNHNTINTASSRSIGVISHGRFACLANTPFTDTIGTEIKMKAILKMSFD